MSIVAGIIATKTDENASLHCLTRIAGTTLLERQVRLLILNNVNKVFLIIKGNHKDLEEEVERLVKLKIQIEYQKVDDNGKLNLEQLNANYGFSKCFLINSSTIIDPRLPKNLLEGSEKIALIPKNSVKYNESILPVIHNDDREMLFAGAALLSFQALSSIKFDDEENLVIGLQGLLTNRSVELMDLSKKSTYVTSMRRHLPFLCVPIKSQDDNHNVKSILLEASQKKINEWPVEYIWKPVEDWIIYRICEWPVTPNQITLISHLCSFTTLFLFAMGRALPALLLAVLVGLLDGLDGKQARVKGLTTKFGDVFDHVLDRVNEYGWFVAIAFSLYQHGFGFYPWMLLALFLLGYLLEWPLLNKVKAHFGVSIDDWGIFERKFRLIAGRRETYVWTLIPFIVYGAFNDSLIGLYNGFWAITIYGVLTVTIRSWRCLLKLYQNRKGQLSLLSGVKQ